MYRIACFATPIYSHFTNVHSIVSALGKSGAQIGIWTNPEFHPLLPKDCVGFYALDRHGWIDSLLDPSMPRPVRFTVDAVLNFDSTLKSVKQWKPDLILVEGFSLLGRLIADELNCPWILLNASHIPNGESYRNLVRDEFPAIFSDVCLKSVEQLKTRFGHSDPSPFSYIIDPSPFGTIHFEPSQWPDYKDSGHRDVYYWGSSSQAAPSLKERTIPSYKNLRIYAAFGTIMWRYWATEALKTLNNLADICLEMEISLTIGLGGTAISANETRNLKNKKAIIKSNANQIYELKNNDLFLTHHGLNSTHEAVRQLIPMISVPFAGDQNSLAERAQCFKLALVGTSHLATKKNIPSAYCFGKLITASVEAYKSSQEHSHVALEWDHYARESRPNILKAIFERI